MIKNYLNVVLKNISKNKLTFLVNIFGLAVGIASCIIILQYINYEMGYEDWNKNADNIYRLVVRRYNSGELTYIRPHTPLAMGPTMKRDFPEVVEYARLYRIMSEYIVILRDNYFREKIFGVDSSFLRMFTFKMVSGDSKTALDRPFSAVISRSLAKKYFGSESPIGKSIKLCRFQDVKVCFITGVFEDLPQNTHLKCDMLVSLHDTINVYRNNEWYEPHFYLYIRLDPPSDPKSLEAKLPAFVDKYFSKKMVQANHRFDYFLQPLKAIHLHSDQMQYKLKEGGDVINIYFLSILVIFILCIAWINYINLSVIKSIDRAKEVGVRKVVGADKSQLIKQFFVEFVLLSLIGVLLAVVLVIIFIPFFNQLFGISLSFSLIFKSKVFLFVFLLVFIAGTLLSGLYPAFVLSSFRPVEVIKGRIFKSKSGINVRKVLLIFQFVVSIIFIVATLTISRQIKFMRNQDLGINLERVILVRTALSMYNFINSRDREKVFFDELKKHPSISNVTMGNSPGKEYYGTWQLRRIDSFVLRDFAGNWIDYDFLDTYQLGLLSGRNFSRDYPSDRFGPFMLNEKALKVFNFKNPEEAIGKYLVDNWGYRHKIIGVTKNYHQQSLKYDIKPLVYAYTPHAGEFYSVKLKNPKDINEVIEYIKEKYEEILPGNPFSYVFLDDFFDYQYAAENKSRRAFLLFAVIATIICCLGLYALVSYSTFQREKEIAIRKVYGAKTFDILFILLKDIFKLVFTAVIFVFPIAVLVLNKWLENFIYRIKIDLWFFINPVLLISVIVLLTVSYKVIKVAIANPVNSLRNE